MAAAVGDRVEFLDSVGRVVSDIVIEHMTKTIGYRAYGTDQVISALKLKNYGWVPEAWVLNKE